MNTTAYREHLARLEEAIRGHYLRGEFGEARLVEAEAAGWEAYHARYHARKLTEDSRHKVHNIRFNAQDKDPMPRSLSDEDKAAIVAEARKAVLARAQVELTSLLEGHDYASEAEGYVAAAQTLLASRERGSRDSLLVPLAEYLETLPEGLHFWMDLPRKIVARRLASALRDLLAPEQTPQTPV